MQNRMLDKSLGSSYLNVRLMSPQIFTKNNHNTSKHGSGKDRYGTFGSGDYPHLTSHGGTAAILISILLATATLVLQ